MHGLLLQSARALHVVPCTSHVVTYQASLHRPCRNDETASPLTPPTATAPTAANRPAVDSQQTHFESETTNKHALRCGVSLRVALRRVANMPVASSHRCIIGHSQCCDRQCSAVQCLTTPAAGSSCAPNRPHALRAQPTTPSAAARRRIARTGRARPAHAPARQAVHDGVRCSY